VRAALGLCALLLLHPAAAPGAPKPPAAEAPPRPGAALAKLPQCPLPPESWVPVAGLQEPFAAGRFEEVERALHAAHADFEKDPLCEQRMLRPFLAGFYGPIDELERGFDRWVEARPDSWTARTLRGVFWVQEAYRRRGGGSGASLSDEERRGMREAIDRALPDLERAIALHPRAVVAHGGLLDAHRIYGDTERIVRAWERAREIDPLSLYLRERAIHALEPWWGGSMDAVREIVADARKHVARNPQLMRLYGYPSATGAGMLENQLREKPEVRGRAIALYTDALRWGEATSSWHLSRVRLEVGGRMTDAALADIAYALEVDPAQYWFQDWRIRALQDARRHEEALAAVRDARRHLGDPYGMVWWEGIVLRDLGRWDEAAKAFLEAAHCCGAPDGERAQMLEGAGHTLREAGRIEESVAPLRETTALAPGRFQGWLLLGRSLRELGRHEEASRALRRYLELSEGEPDEAATRAHVKRDLQAKR
jgi:tetratricopeptide (TPR) repeat protein